MTRDLGTDMYTLLYLKQITNKDLLYHTRNSVQYSVITEIRKEFEKEQTHVCIYIYIYIKQNHFIIPETNTTLLINSTPLKF